MTFDSERFDARGRDLWEAVESVEAEVNTLSNFITKWIESQKQAFAQRQEVATVFSTLAKNHHHQNDSIMIRPPPQQETDDDDDVFGIQESYSSIAKSATTINRTSAEVLITRPAESKHGLLTLLHELQHDCIAPFKALLKDRETSTSLNKKKNVSDTCDYHYEKMKSFQSEKIQKVLSELQRSEMFVALRSIEALTESLGVLEKTT